MEADEKQLDLFSPLPLRTEFVRSFVSSLFNSRHRLLDDFCVAYELHYIKPWPEKINKGGWETGGVKWNGEMLTHGPEIMPTLYLLAKRYPQIKNAGYSVLLPGAEIAPHRGYTDEVLRLHFPLVVPNGDCGIKIDGVQYQWVLHEPLLFDDTLEHEAWNRTNDARIIVLFDIGKIYL